MIKNGNTRDRTGVNNRQHFDKRKAQENTAPPAAQTKANARQPPRMPAAPSHLKAERSAACTPDEGMAEGDAVEERRHKAAAESIRGAHNALDLHLGRIATIL